MSKSAPRGADRTEAWVTEAWAMVDEGGEAALSLRALAQRVGVTQPALYRHFASRDALLDEVSARGMLALDAELAAFADVGAWHALRDGGRTLLRYALGHPGWFRLAFGRQRVGPMSARMLGQPQPGRMAAISALTRVVPPDDPAFGDTFRVYWALLLGLANMLLEQTFQLVQTDEARLAAAYDVLDCWLDQLRARWGDAHHPPRPEDGARAIVASAAAIQRRVDAQGAG